MGSYVQVPALNIPVSDPMTQLYKLQQLRAMQQQQQYQQQQQPLELQQQQQQVALQQQQLRDQQAGQAAYGDWDGQSYSDLASLIIKHGGSLAAAQQVAAFGLARQKDLSDIHKNEGQAGLDRITAMQKNDDTAAGRFDALNNVSDDQLPAAFQSTLQEGLQNGWIDQQHAQLGQQIAQMPAAQIRDALPHIVKGYQSESAQKEAALKAAQTSEAGAKAQETQALMAMGGTPAMQDVLYTNLKAQQAGGAQLNADQQNFIKGYEARKLLVPQFRVENRQGPQGTWQLVEDQQGNPMVFNSATGQTQPAPGIQKTGTYAKTVGGPQAAVTYATNYLSDKQYTGPGDEALMEQFFEMAKPSSGFRMSQPQIDMLKQARGWMDSAEAIQRHATTGTWFSDTQRGQIVSTMNSLGAAKGLKAAPGTTGGSNRPPLTSFER